MNCFRCGISKKSMTYCKDCFEDVRIKTIEDFIEKFENIADAAGTFDWIAWEQIKMEMRLGNDRP